MQNSTKIAVRILAAVMALVLVLGLVAMTANAQENGAVCAMSAEGVVASYENLDAALAAADENVTYYQLTANVDGGSIDRDILLDLNGFDLTNVTVAEGVTVRLMDSANDGYDASKCGSFSGTINGTVEQLVQTTADEVGAVKSYLVINQDGAYSAHRFYAGITKISLVPDQVALGYKAEYYADEVINAMVTGYGYELWINSLNPVQRMKDSNIADNELTLRLKNILSDNEAVSAIGATATINGNAVIRFNVDGQELTVTGADHSTTLKNAVEAVNASLGQNRTAYTTEQVVLVRAMCTKYESYMNEWEQEYIFTEDKFTSVENVTATYGQSLTLGQVFIPVEGMTIGENVTVTVNGEEITANEDWADTILNLNAGEAVITITDNNRCWTATNTVVVEKADPAYEIPAGLTAEVGQTLADIILPEGFAWVNSDQTIDTIGIHTYDAIYDLGDSNYNTADVEISLTVKDHTVAERPVPTSGYATDHVFTLGEVFEANGYEIDSTQVTATVDGEALTVNTADWTATEFTLNQAGTHEIQIFGGEYCLGASITLTVEEKQDKFVAKTVAPVVFGNSLTLGDLFEGTGINSKVTYTVNGETYTIIPNPTTADKWAAQEITFDAVGTYEITIVESILCNVATNTVTVVKADPTYEVPTGLTATYGDTLADVTLTGGWAWKDSSASVGNAGTNSFAAVYTPADTANYNTAEVEISVAVAKADPSYEIPTGLTATYGDTLADVTLSGGFAWKDSSASVGNAGINSFAAVYTPADTANYNTAEVEISVAVAKADPTYEVPTGLTATYGQTLADVALTGGWAWKDSSASVGNAGTNSFAAVYTPADTANYNTAEVEISVAVAKADPTYEVPTGLTATYGQTLADVALTGGWTWKDSTASVGNAGTNSFIAVYTPADTANYNTVEVTVSVAVAKANPTYTVPTGLTATYGQTLADVALPEGFTWADDSVSVGDAGTQTHTAIYNAGENYNTVEVTVTIAVAKADIEAPAVDTLNATYGDTLADVALPEGFTWADDTASVGNAGTQTHTAIYNAGENYNTVEVTVTVEVAKADVEAPAVDTLNATYGDTLADVALPEGFSWADDTVSVGDAGTQTHTAIYNAGENYNTVEVTVTIAVAKADIEAPAVDTLNATYGNTLADVALPEGFTWVDDSASVGNAGTNSFAAVYTPADTANYNTVEVTVSVAVAKANPTYTAPTGLTATYGQTLADVALTGGFTWTDSGLSVGNAGNNTFTVTYTPDDTDNYNVVTGIEVTVAVSKADSTCTAPTANVLTYTGNAQNLITAGTATGGKLVYKVGEGEYSETIPTATNAGTYTVYYKVEATDNYNGISEKSITVTISRANPTYTVPTGLKATEGQTLADVALSGGWTWKDSSLSVGSAGTNSFTAVYTPDDTANYNKVEVSLSVEVAAAQKIDKFDKVLTSDFLYRVGNVNTVALSSLFKAKDGVEIGTVTATITNVAGDAAGAYTANSTWTAGTIQFSGTGVVEVTISDATSNPVTITLEVVAATNVTAYSGLKNQNSVLLNDITMSSGGSYSLSGGNTLYGNGFTLDMTNGTYAAGGNTSSNYVFNLAGANLDNVKIVGAVYTQYGATVQSEYNRAAVLTSGNCTITNSYISNCASAVRVKDGNLEIINSTIKGGNFANIDIRGGNVVLDNVTTINQVNGNDTAKDGTIVVGLGVVVYYENVLNTTTVTVKNGITQYNVMSKAQASEYITDSTANQLTEKIFTVNDVIYNDGTDKWVNAGILSMTADTVGDANISDVDGYIDATATLTGVSGYVHTKVPTAADTTASAPAYTSAGQGPIAPSYSFDYTTKNYVAKTDGSNDYCYYENGTVMLSMDAGDTFNWDTSILTATKVGQTLDYTVTMNGTDYTGKSIAFSEAGAYQVVYTYTDSNNYALDENGEVTTYSKTYTKTVHISVAAVEAAAKHAEFTMGSSGAATEKITVDNVTYISATGVTADNSTWTYMTIGDQKIYYPIIAAKLTSTKGSSTYAYFPVFENAVTITDYADSGTGDAFTYSASTTTLPSTLTAVKGVYKAASDVSYWYNLTNSNLTQSGASNIFKWASSSSAPSDPTTYNSVLCYKSPQVSADRVAYITLVQYSYTDATNTTYYYYVGYTLEAFTKQTTCFTADTLITMADGSQKEVQYVTAEDLIQVWDFYTGEYAVVPAGYVMDHGYGENTEVKLTFADGTTIKVVNEHGFFDVAANEFVFINESNVADYVGHSFAKQSGDGFESVELVNYTVTTGYMESWSILSYGMYNCFAEGMLTLTAHEAEGNFFMPFEVGADMKFDEAKMHSDIETYGLYTYEEFADVMSKELFDALNMPYVKVAVGKGITSEEDIWYLLNLHFGIER